MCYATPAEPNKKKRKKKEKKGKKGKKKEKKEKKGDGGGGGGGGLISFFFFFIGRRLSFPCSLGANGFGLPWVSWLRVGRVYSFFFCFVRPTGSASGLVFGAGGGPTGLVTWDRVGSGLVGF